MPRAGLSGDVGTMPYGGDNSVAEDRQDNVSDTQRQSLAARFGGVAGATRGWLSARRRTLSVMAGAVLLVTLGSAALWLSVSAARLAMQPPATLDEALEALDRGAYVEARHLIKGMLETAPAATESLGGPAFVLGAVTLQETADGWGRNKTSLFLVAARYLEDARDRGFPPGRRAEGLYYLGKSLYLAGRTSDCRPPLQEALEAGWRDPSVIHHLLADAHLQDANPTLVEALHHNAEYLAAPNVKGARRADGLLQRARILFDLGRNEESREIIADLPAELRERADVTVLSGRLLIHAARQAGATTSDLYAQAIRVFGQAQARDTLDRQATRRATYLIGVCLAEMGEDHRSAALDQLTRTRKLYLESPEGLAAGLLEADLLRTAGRGKQAVEIYRSVMSAAGNPRDYSNPWLSLDALRSRLMAAYEAFSKNDQFDLAVKLLGGFQPLFSKLQTLELTAATARLWGLAIELDALALPEGAAPQLHRQARRQFRSAGYAYLRLAAARSATRSYQGDLWNSAQNLLRGHDFRTARTTLEKYLDEQTARWRGPALVGLGKANLALGRVDESIAALRECIDFHPRDAAVFTARLWGSKAYFEKGEYQQAEALLRANLTSDSLTPASVEWRDSLFALGELLLVQQEYDKAITRLEEAVDRYSESETRQAMRATYLIGKAYREATHAPQTRLRQAAVPSVQVASRRRIRQLLDKALHYYSTVQQHLLDQEERFELTTLDRAMLRNCYLAKGAILSDLARYDQAIDVYSDATRRYQDDPIALAAFVQMAHCYRRQRKRLAARAAVEQAKVLLQQFPTDQDFTTTTNYTRVEWVALLDQLSG
jgi:tetratricopeptide (TPR) repeat protein